MNTTDFDGMVAGMRDAIAHAKGEKNGVVVTMGVETKAVRKKTKLSQAKFAQVFGLEVRSIQDWEQGRRTPDRAAQTLYHLIDRHPQEIMTMMAE